ncbi:MAG TPA: SRPBCC domain-containing protein [Gaiellaceae bacterium]|nr:SRPBCC domain-containing protein [Gaiellaceae bacterium]
MPRSRAELELAAPPGDVWRFLAEPRHLADWWPNLATVEPDRRGLAVGARWRVRSREPTLFRRAYAEDTLLVTVVEPERRFAFELARTRLRAELALAPAGEGRTRAALEVSGPLLVGFSRSLAKDALARLYALCQTAASL